jgi:hypothetical protein
MAQQPLVVQGLFIIEASLSHSDTPHSTELLWTSDQPVAETSTWQHTTQETDIHGSTGFEHNIPTNEWLQTQALDRADDDDNNDDNDDNNVSFSLTILDLSQ